MDDAIESMYARRYRLADFVAPSDALDHGRQLIPDTDSDDDAAVATQFLPRFKGGHRGGTGSGSAARPLLMKTVDLSFVGSIGAVLSK
jgi:hypothetical protein